MKVVLYMISLAGGGGLVLPEDAADRLIALASPDAALLYIFLLRRREDYSHDAASDALKMPLQRVKDVFSSLEQAGLVSGGAQEGRKLAPRSEPPEYSRGDIAKSAEEDAGFRRVVEDVQKRLGKLLSSSDLCLLFGIYDWLGLPPEVIAMLVTHCVSAAEERFGPGRLPTMRQIEKEAAVWEREGVLCAEDAERHLKKLENSKSALARLSSVLQIRGRRPTASEERYMLEWAGYGMDDEVIYKAYDITVLKTGALRWGYLGSILKSWHEKGICSVEDIEKKDAPPKREGAGGRAPAQDGKSREKSAADRLRNIGRKGGG